MTTREIQQYTDTAIRGKFADLSSECGEITTSEEGDGRFFGKVTATRYAGFAGGRDIFLAVGETEMQAQIVKLGRAECLRPKESDLDFMLLKELGIE